jgi:hypothetical protein
MKNQFGPTKPPPHVPVLTEVVPESHTIPGALMVLRSPELAPEPESVPPELQLEFDPPFAAVALTTTPTPLVSTPVPSSAIAAAMATLIPAPQDQAPTGLEAAPVQTRTESAIASELPSPPAPKTTTHHIPQIASGFGGNWWFSKDVPIVAPPQPTPLATPLEPSAVIPTLPSEAALVKRILVSLDSHLREEFEPRLREVATPVLTKVTDALLSQLRQQLTLSLREMVITAVVTEMARASSGDSQ